MYVYGPTLVGHETGGVGQTRLSAKQSVFFSKSVKKSVKRGVRVLSAKRASERKKTDSLHSLALCFQLRSRPFV